MASGGTLLSDLGNEPGGSDSDLVQQILADMNSAPSLPNPIVQSSQGQGYAQAAPPPPQGPRAPPVMNAPNPNSTYAQANDPNIPTAHLIGRDHPTEADFQRMMMAQQPPAVQPMGASPTQGMAEYQPVQPRMAAPTPVVQALPPPSKNWQAQVMDELKAPALVALVCFFVTLPAVNLLVAHYVPRLLRPGGDLNMLGIFVRALFAGLLFWFVTRVVAPLVVL